MIVTRGQAWRDALHRDLAQLGLEWPDADSLMEDCSVGGMDLNLYWRAQRVIGEHRDMQETLFHADRIADGTSRRTLTEAAAERAAAGPYAASPFSTGLTQGYLTMDVLAATVFGIVVIQTLRSRGIGSTGRVVRATAAAGGIAAALLAAVYIGLAMIGTRTGGAADDGTALLRSAASSALGPAGVIVFAAIVILACLTTSVGLLSAWAGYAYATLPRTTFSRHLVAGAGCALILSNLGLAVIIRIVAPLTLLLYPITITLVAATILDVVAPGRLRTAYTWPVAVAGVLGLVSALAEAGWNAPSALLARSGAWNGSTGWIAPTLLALVLGAALDVRAGRWSTPANDMSDAAEDVERAVIGQR